MDFDASELALSEQDREELSKPERPSLVSMVLTLFPDEQERIERNLNDLSTWHTDSKRAKNAALTAIAARMCQRYLTFGEDFSLDMCARHTMGLPLDPEIEFTYDYLERKRDEQFAMFSIVTTEAAALEAEESSIQTIQSCLGKFTSGVFAAFISLSTGNQLKCISRDAGSFVTDRGNQQLDLWKWTCISPPNEIPDPKGKIQRFIRYLLGLCAVGGFKHSGGEIYERKNVKYKGKSYSTPAFVSKGKIETWIRDNCKNQGQPEFWNLMVESRFVARAVEHLENSRDVEFPPLEVDLEVSVWNNGIYIAKDRKFHEFGTNTFTGGGVGACTFHDADFPISSHESFAQLLEESKSPFLRILRDQEYNTEEELLAILGLFGRNLHVADVFEKFQMFVFIAGQTGTGKGTLVRAMNALLPRNMTHPITASTYEEKFGLAALHDKQLVSCAETTSTARFPTDQLLSMSGDDALSVSTKHQKASPSKGKPRLLFAGHQVPDAWKSAIDALLRRMCLLNFNNLVVREQTLDRDMHKYRGHSMLLLNEAFFYFIEKLGEVREPWAIIPEKIRKGSEWLKTQNSTIAKFISECVVEIKPEDPAYDPTQQRGISLGTLVKSYNSFLTSGKSRQAIKEDKFKESHIKNSLINEMRTFNQVGFKLVRVGGNGRGKSKRIFPNVKLIDLDLLGDGSEDEEDDLVSAQGPKIVLLDDSVGQGDVKRRRLN